MRTRGDSILGLVCGVAYFVLASGPVSASSSGQDRAAYLERFEAEGLSEQVFDEVLLWGEGLHLMGRCHKQLRDDQTEYWKTWWDYSVLVDTAIGQEVIQAGLDEFDRGVTRSVTEPLSPEQCAAVIGDWLKDMRRAAETERVSS